MRIREYYQVKPAGTDPDPAVFCPAEGYILNPIDPAEWTLLAEFDNNSPNSTTFDPVITASAGQYAWDLGDGTILVGQKSVSHTYLTTATRTVKLYGKGTCTITAVDFNADNIVGELDLSNDAFKPLTNILLYTNALLSSVVFPSSPTGTVATLGIYSTGITGNLNLSMYSAFSASATIQLNSNASMTGITWASSITGTFSQLILSVNPGLTGTLDLSKFSAFTTSATINLNNIANVTGITWASSITGTFLSLLMSSTGITGTLDLSKFSAFTSSAQINIGLNASLTGVTWASSITGTFSTLYVHSTGYTGTLDLSKFSAFTSSAQIHLYSNSSMTGVTWASSITGTFSQFYIYGTGYTGTLDLSKFSAFTSSAQIQLNSNASMTGITWASSITGTFNQLYIYSTGITGTLDLSKFTTFTATATVSIQLNSSLTGVTFPSSTITGFVRTLSMDSCASLSYVDTTKLRTGVASLAWRFDGCGWSAAIVNQVLVDIDGISASGFTGRVINIGGTNADPTTGPPDGTAARTSLQGKGFTVTIT